MREINVTVVYALPDTGTAITVRLPVGATLGEAIACVSADARLAGVDVAGCPVGVFGKRARRDTVLADGDRVELYRSLRADPHQARRRRAAHKRP